MKRLQFLALVKDWFLKLSPIKKIILFVFVIGAGWFLFSKGSGSNQKQQEYQTAKVERGTLIVSVSVSGQVASENSASVTTSATGVVSKLYVSEGDEVKTGEKIAEIDLDLIGQQKAAQALASYQSAKNTLEAAKANLYTLQSDMFTQWDEFYELATNSTYQNADGTANETNRALPEFHIAQKDWLAAEAKYKNQQDVVTQAQTALNSARLSYQQSSSTIYASISGNVSGLSIQVGSVIRSQSDSSSSTSSTAATSSQKVTSIKTEASPTISVNLTEIDAPKVKVGDKATITLDAFSGKTYTGSVVSVDTIGEVSSGVTSYPAIIKLDTEAPGVLPNMSATANIITETKNNVLLVPTSAVATQAGASTVQVLKNGQVAQVEVETGLSSTNEIEIVSGLSEGYTVITGNISTQTGQRSGSGQSPFGGFGGVRMIR